MDIDFAFQKLFNHFNVLSMRDLSKKINISESTISKWRQRKSISAIKKACLKLGIYNEIFGDLNSNINNQIIRDNQGNVSQTGNVYNNKDSDDDNIIDEAALAMFKRAYNRCVDDNGNIIENKLDELIIYLTKFK